MIGGIGIGPDVPPSTGTLTLPSITVDGKLGFIMSGHVAGNGQTGQDIEHAGVKIGTVIDNDPLSNRTSDSAFVESVSGSNLKMDIFNHNDPNNHYNVVDAIDSSDTDLFDLVLRSGISEGEQSGAIGAKGVTITDAIGTLTNQVITTGTVSDDGDSGGPYFSLPDANNNVKFYGLYVG